MKVWVYDWNALPTPQIIDINEPAVDCLMSALKKVFELNTRVADCEAARQGAGDLKQDWHFVKTDLYNNNRPALLFQRTYIYLVMYYHQYLEHNDMTDLVSHLVDVLYHQNNQVL